MYFLRNSEISIDIYNCILCSNQEEPANEIVKKDSGEKTISAAGRKSNDSGETQKRIFFSL